MTLWIYKILKDFMNFKDLLKWNDYDTLSIIIFSIHTIFFQEIGGREREKGEGEERRERGEREEKKQRDGKILKEKQSQEISCFHERLFHAKISLEYPTKSIKI